MRKIYSITLWVLAIPFLLSACFDKNVEECARLVKDESKQTFALAYCEKAAENGDSASQLYLANLLFEQNEPQKAIKSLEKAANQQNGEALFLFGQLYEAGQYVEKNLDTAIFYYKQGCTHNVIKACEREHNLLSLRKENEKREQERIRKEVESQKLEQQRLANEAEKQALEKARIQTLELEKAKAEAEAKRLEQQRLADEAAKKSLEKARAQAIELEKATAERHAQEKAKADAEAKKLEQQRLANEAELKKAEAAELKAKTNRKFRYGLAKYEKNGLWGHINENGDIVIPLQFAYAADFYEGLAAVKTLDGKWGFINTSGQYQIQPTFRCVYYFSEGLSAVAVSGYGKNCVNGKWGFIDYYGNWVISPVLDAVHEVFKNGAAKVDYNGYTGYMNRNGEWLN